MKLVAVPSRTAVSERGVRIAPLSNGLMPYWTLA